MGAAAALGRCAVSTDTAGSGDTAGGRGQGHRAGRPRRALLAGAAAALAAVTAETLGRAAPAQASPGQPVLQSTDNVGNTQRTAVFTTGNNEWAQLAVPDDAGLGSLGIYAHGQDFGVYADTTVGTGVFGIGGGGSPGVQGSSNGDAPGVAGVGGGTNPGVAGTGGAAGGIGVFGGGTAAAAGVQGVGGSNDGTGVAGFGGTNPNGGGGAGVAGTGLGSGAGVIGKGGSAGGDGVTGTAAGTGSGVVGTAAGLGSGVLAQNTGTGPALNVLGLASFNRSGILTFSKGKSSVTKHGIALGADSLIFATLQANVPGTWVQSAVGDVAGSSLTVHLNKAVTTSTRVAWFVIN
jgi:hypothetical protein